MQSPVRTIGFGSTLIKRVCRATLQAETYALQDGVENGFRLRALLAEIHDCLGDHESVCPHMWLSVCASLVQHLTASNGANVADKRLGTEMESLRQPLEEQLDVLKWIDTSAMATDCMAKNMKPD